jgi:hypothetical protein
MVAKKKQEVVDADLMADFASDAGEGLEDVSHQDLLIPFVSILQKLSPQVNKRKAEYIEGAEPGMILETASRTLYDGEEKGIIVVPIKYQRRYTEFRPRDQGGGLVNDYGDDATILDRCTQGERGGYTTPEGNDLIVSGNFYCFIMDKDGSYRRAVISMSGSQLKKSRRWNTLLMQERAETPNGDVFVPPAYYRTYHLTTVPEENDQGDWFGWEIDKAMTLPEAFPNNAGLIRQEAKLFKKDVSTQKVLPAQDPTTQIEGPPKTDKRLDDDIPF